MAESRTENLCAPVCWLLSVLYHRNCGLPKVLRGSWAKPKVLWPVALSAARITGLVPAPWLWRLHSCPCQLCSLQSRSPVVACPTPQNGLDILLQTHQGNSSLLHPPATLFSSEALPLPSPFFWLILILFLSLLWLSMLVVPKGCVRRSPQLVQPGSPAGVHLSCLPSSSLCRASWEVVVMTG